MDMNDESQSSEPRNEHLNQISMEGNSDAKQKLTSHQIAVRSRTLEVTKTGENLKSL